MDYALATKTKRQKRKEACGVGREEVPPPQPPLVEAGCEEEEEEGSHAASSLPPSVPANLHGVM